MADAHEWWRTPRRVRVIVDNPSWVLPHAKAVVDRALKQGDYAELVRDYDGEESFDVSFFLGCVRLAPPAFLSNSRINLVVHASDLPEGRGFSPLTWYVLEGRSNIPVCLLHAADDADAGPVVYRASIGFQGHELVDEMRVLLGEMTVELCLRYLSEAQPLMGTPQTGDPTFFRRRRPEDSRLNPHQSISEQFDLLRVVDNEKYPAFFEHMGRRYVLKIEQSSE